jgi:hypothetical protein
MSNQNTFTVNLSDGREVCFSYGVPVAAFIPGRGYVRSAEYHSTTSSKHANAYAGADAPKVPASEFADLIAPVTAR